MEADLWRGGGMVERVRLGGFVERVRGLRARQESRLAGVVIPELADGTFSRARGFSFASATGLRDSTIDALAGSRGRALRVFAALVPWRSHDGISRTSCGHPGAFLARKNSPHGRKMTPPDLPHLLHPVSPVHKMSDS